MSFIEMPGLADAKEPVVAPEGSGYDLVIWNKIWFDLWHNKTRTLLAVLSIAVGVFAVGAMFGMADMMSTEMDRSHQSVQPPHINIILSEPVARDILLGALISMM